MNQEHANKSQIQALQQKRTLAFINHFVMTNVQFLNNFMKNCEQKLMVFERKLEKVNAAMVLLETRLSSIPEISIPQPTTDVKATPTTTEQSLNIITEQTPDVINEAEESKDKSSCKVRPEYDRFLKMVQVGVPVQAVKLKVSLEGLDPNILDEILGK